MAVTEPLSAGFGVGWACAVADLGLTDTETTVTGVRAAVDVAVAVVGALLSIEFVAVIAVVAIVVVAVAAGTLLSIVVVVVDAVAGDGARPV